MELTEKHAIPILKKLQKPLPTITFSMYKELSIDTYNKAIMYANANNLKIEYRESSIKYIEKRLVDLKGNNYDEMKILFEKNAEEIILMAAFLGEIILKAWPGGKWIWNTENYIRPSETPTEFFVVYPPKVSTFEIDTLFDICGYWIDHPELKFNLLNCYNKTLELLKK